MNTSFNGRLALMDEMDLHSDSGSIAIGFLAVLNN